MDKNIVGIGENKGFSNYVSKGFSTQLIKPWVFFLSWIDNTGRLCKDNLSRLCDLDLWPTWMKLSKGTSTHQREQLCLFVCSFMQQYQHYFSI